VIGIWPTPILKAIEPAAAGIVAPYVKLIERDAAAKPAKAADAVPAPAITTALATAPSTGASE
jgi:hypothetical protein